MDLPARLGPERLRAYPVVMIIVAAVVWVGWLLAGRDGLDPAGKPVGADYVAFHAAGTLVAEDRAADVYDLLLLQVQVTKVLPATDAVLPVHYPPPALIAFALPARLPFTLGLVVWTFGSVGAVAVMLGLLRTGPLGWRWAFAYPGTLLVLFNGQTTAWVAASVCGGLALAARRPFVGGLVVGLSVLKPNYLVLPLVVLAVGLQGRALAGVVVSSVACCLLSLAVLGTDTWAAWLHHVPELGTLLASGQLQAEKMPTATGSVSVLGGGAAAILVAQGVSALVAAVGVIAAARRADPDRRVAAVAFGTFLLTPFAFDYDLVVAWAGLYLLGRHAAGRPPWPLLAAGFALPLVLPALAAVHLPVAPLVLGALLLYAAFPPVDPRGAG